eukprot:m.368329 g.368329  ORF g.368329 m.368329 type:complete len:55 (-) comp44627_c0_seq1:5-169(-)
MHIFFAKQPPLTPQSSTTATTNPTASITTACTTVPQFFSCACSLLLCAPGTTST